MAEIDSGMNLYEFNKSTLVNAPSATSAEMDLMRSRVRKYLANNPNANRYYMLLCRELADYTLFNSTDLLISECSEVMEADIQDCFNNRNMEIMMMDINNDNVVEIWVRVNHTEEDIPNEIYLYHLFPCDMGVIEYCNGGALN